MKGIEKSICSMFCTWSAPFLLVTLESQRVCSSPCSEKLHCQNVNIYILFTCNDMVTLVPCNCLLRSGVNFVDNRKAAEHTYNVTMHVQYHNTQ